MTTSGPMQEVRWTGEIDGWLYRVLIVEGAVVTESRPDKYSEWKVFSRSGFGSNIREVVLEQAVLAPKQRPRRVRTEPPQAKRLTRRRS